VIAVLLGRLQSSSTTGGRYDPVTRTIDTTVGRPGAYVDGWLQRGSQSVEGFASGPAMRRRIRELEAQANGMGIYMERVEMLEEQIRQLRAMLELPSFGESLRIKGRLVRYYPIENRATLNIGSSQQVRVGCPVVTGEGLVGVIQSVSPTSSQVRLITAPKPFLIGATVRGNPPVAGLLHGEGSDKLIAEFSDLNAQIRVGDLVVTSGQSEKVMGDIVIGRVVQVNFDPEFGSRTAQIYPAVQFSQVREVFVLR